MRSHPGREWPRAGEAPERILHATVDLSGDWSGWRESAIRESDLHDPPLRILDVVLWMHVKTTG